MSKLCRLVLVLAVIFPLCGWAEPASLHLTVLHTNDTHGALFSADASDNGEVGGAARLAAMVTAMRKDDPAVLLLDAGDIMSRGDATTIVSGGEANFRVMGMMGYDAIVPGNGDFYWGIDALLERQQAAAFPIVDANLAYKNGQKGVFQPYVIKEIAGMKIAILGLGFIHIEHPGSRKVDLLDPVQTARHYVPMLRQQADIVIALTHIGKDADIDLAKHVPGIDIIVGGHSHTELEEAIDVTGPDGRHVYIVQAGDKGRYLGRLDVSLEQVNGKIAVKHAEGCLVPNDGRDGEDVDVNAVLAEYTAKLEETVCTAESALTKPQVGVLLAEAVKEVTRADVVLLDDAVVRKDIAPGKVTLADACTIHPWRNHVVMTTLTAAQIQKVLSKDKVHVAGCTLEEKGRLVEIGGKPVEKGRTYRVALGDYLWATSPLLHRLPIEETPLRLDIILLERLRQGYLAGCVLKKAA